MQFMNYLIEGDGTLLNSAALPISRALLLSGIAARAAKPFMNGSFMNMKPAKSLRRTFLHCA